MQIHEKYLLMLLTNTKFTAKFGSKEADLLVSCSQIAVWLRETSQACLSQESEDNDLLDTCVKSQCT